MRRLIWLALLVAAMPARADFQSTNNVQITGQVGAGTFAPRARLEIQLGPNDPYALRVSSNNGTILTVIDNAGHLGIGTAYPQSRLDVGGSGDNGSIGLWLRGGNSTSTTLSSQITFGLASTDTYRHSIGTRHTSGQTYHNAVDFFLWNSTGNPSALGTQNVLTIEGSMASSSASFHVDPFGAPIVELEVSNGQVTGGGTILRAAAGVHSSRALKNDIRYLTDAEVRQALEDVRALKHAQFRYKAAKQQPLHRGLIYEDAPASIQGAGKTIVFDYRLANMEMALKEVDRQIAELESKIAQLEAQKRGKK